MIYSPPINLARYTNGVMVKLTASSREFVSYDYDPDTGTGTYSPETITINASFQGGITFGKWQMSLNGIDWVDLPASEALTIEPTTRFFGSGNAVTIRCISDNPMYYDTITILRSTDSLMLYRKASTKILDNGNKISLIASEEQLRQFTDSQTLVSKVSQMDEDAEGFRQTVTMSYATKQYADDKASDVTTAAASDATAKANAAQQAAINAAAADATDKANAAKGYTDDKLTGYSTTSEMTSAIEQSANSIRQSVSSTYVTTNTFQSRMEDMEDYADGAAGNALESAKADATSKANAAQQAAINTAAADATSKANAAQSAAISTAASDATSKANAAQSAAISAAATDATSKANAALSGAKNYTDGQLESYSTTTQMTSAIEQSATQVRAYAAQVAKVNDNLWIDTGAVYDKCLKPDGTYSNVTTRSYVTSDFIAVKESTAYVAQVWTASTGTIWWRYVFYDANKTVVSALPASNTVYSKSNTTHLATTFTTPAGAAYMRMTHGNNTGSRGWAKIEEGTEATQYSTAPIEGRKINEAYAGINISIDEINTEVSKKVGDDEIISRINQSAEGLKIQAGYLDINGVISANGNFKVNTDGTIEAKSAELSGHISGSTVYGSEFCTVNDPDDTSGAHVYISGGRIDCNKGRAYFTDTVDMSGEGPAFIYGPGLARNTQILGGDLLPDTVYQSIALMSKYWISLRINYKEWLGLISSSVYSSSETYYNDDGNRIYSGINLYSPTTCHSTLRVTGTKPRLVEDTKYGDRLMYAYETPTPMFGDVGFGRTDETGACYVMLDDIYLETVESGTEYAVFLQKEGSGDLWVDQKEDSYFVVKGTANLAFSWELKTVQKGFRDLRLDEPAIVDQQDVDDLTTDLDEDLQKYDAEMEDIFR